MNAIKYFFNFSPKKNSLGLCLSGGGALGFAHIGVIQALEDNGIYPTHIIGSSMGAIIGTFYAAGYSPKDLLQLIITRSQMIEEYYWKHAVTRDLLELRNIILVAELIVRSALKRRESRGGHYREDYPAKSHQQQESVLQLNDFKEFV